MSDDNENVHDDTNRESPCESSQESHRKQIITLLNLLVKNAEEASADFDLDSFKRRNTSAFELFIAFSKHLEQQQSAEELKKTFCCDFAVFERGSELTPDFLNLMLLRLSWEAFSPGQEQTLPNEN